MDYRRKMVGVRARLESLRGCLESYGLRACEEHTWPLKALREAAGR